MDDSIPPVLADGSAPTTSDELLAYLETLGIDAVTHEHEPVFTVEEAQAAKGSLPGAHTKNLFVRDKRGRMWIVVALHDRELDLLALSNTLRSMGLATGETLAHLNCLLGRRSISRSTDGEGVNWYVQNPATSDYEQD